MKAIPDILLYCPACSLGIEQNGVRDESEDIEFLKLIKRETKAHGHYKGKDTYKLIKYYCILYPKTMPVYIHNVTISLILSIYLNKIY